MRRIRIHVLPVVVELQIEDSVTFQSIGLLFNFFSFFYHTSLHVICIGNRMNASALRDIWARVMF